EIDVMRRELVAELTATRRELHAKALSLDIAGEEFPDFRIVIDDENALGGWAHLTGKKDRPSSNPLLASPRRFNEGIFVTKTNRWEGQQCSDTNLAPQAMFGHAKTNGGNVTDLDEGRISHSRTLEHEHLSQARPHPGRGRPRHRQP